MLAQREILFNTLRFLLEDNSFIVFFLIGEDKFRMMLETNNIFIIKTKSKYYLNVSNKNREINKKKKIFSNFLDTRQKN